MTLEYIKGLLDLAKIEAWTKEKGPLESVGKRGLAYFCPITQYLKENGVTNPKVERLFVVFDTEEKDTYDQFIRNYYHFEEKFVQLIDLIDGRNESIMLIKQPGSRIQARTLLKLLEMMKNNE